MIFKSRTDASLPTKDVVEPAGSAVMILGEPLPDGRIAVEGSKSGNGTVRIVDLLAAIGQG
jgi:hypothetical protein